MAENEVKKEVPENISGSIKYPDSLTLYTIKNQDSRKSAIDTAKSFEPKTAFVSFSVNKDLKAPAREVIYETDGDALKVDIDATVKGEYSEAVAKVGLYMLLTSKETKKLFNHLYIVDMADALLGSATIDGFDAMNLAAFVLTNSKVPVSVESVAMGYNKPKPAVFDLEADYSKKKSKKKSKDKKKGKKKKKKGKK